METKTTKAAIVAVLASVLVGGFASSSSAATSITAAQANANYTAALTAAKASFLAAVRPSRMTMIDEGKSAESNRRATVKRALVAFNAVVATEKASSLLAEKTYKASVANLTATPTSLSLKASVKANLEALTKVTTALSTDAKISTARAAFVKARTTAMEKFKTALDISATERARTLDRASLRYKADKDRALVILQAALKKASK